MNLPHHRRYSLLSGTKPCPARKCALATIAALIFYLVADSLTAHEESERERVARIALESERMAMDKYLGSLSDEDLKIIRTR